ncbi:hypothetical protein [Paraburkholderia rhynchosiae]|uniref:Uncharacterized protein n=1 Tax=Paraburkholderia rhynchosiae TaxID=487049 RepID=A0A6J5A1D0_9BURK|nr:hypothetical protein [Paraburkholderia rhynchosiae]CAB3649444.1 hypothetical protein LMG27174_01073 [Paraburkholderia rhynchosiae]
MPPLASIITPTANREHLLPAIARCVLRQQVDWQWLILDAVIHPSRAVSLLPRFAGLSVAARLAVSRRPAESGLPRLVVKFAVPSVPIRLLSAR